LLDAAAYAYEQYYSKPYERPVEGCKDIYWEDIGLPHDKKALAARPNHGIANAIRKAMYVPLVVRAYREQYTGGRYGTFALSEAHVRGMQLAMVFEVCGRKSDIGFMDDHGPHCPAPDGQCVFETDKKKCQNVFRSYHSASCAAFKKFAALKLPGRTAKNIAEKEVRDICSAGLEDMYCGVDEPPSKSDATQRVFEVCHDLELFRCYEKDKMGPKMAHLADELGQSAAERLAAAALDALRLTGDRILCSTLKGKRTQKYDRTRFVACMTDPAHCIDVVGRALYGAAWKGGAEPATDAKSNKRPPEDGAAAGGAKRAKK